MVIKHAENDLANLQVRLRHARESRNLTLQEASERSQGEVSAIALGSYERGDRAISAAKLIIIANMYEMPVGELFAQKHKSASPERVTIDLRRIAKADQPVAKAIYETAKRIAAMRSDWNGELLSLRSSDIASLSIFTGLSMSEIQISITQYQFPKLKEYL